MITILRNGLFILAITWSIQGYAEMPPEGHVENKAIPGQKPGFGFVYSDTSGTYLYLPAGQINPRDTLARQYLSPTDETQCCHTISGTAIESQGETQEQVTDEENAEPVLRYRLKHPEPGEMPFLGIVLINPGKIQKLPEQPSSGLAGSDLEISTASGLVRVTTCTSMEGLHLLAFQQKKPIAHLYYALGYDVEANCPEEWFKTAEESP